MNSRIKIITRVAVFAALVFVFSYFAVFINNVNPAFFIVFSAGLLWGIWPGVGVGAIGFFLWSSLNPFGPPPFPILISQIIGISLTAVIGAAAKRWLTEERNTLKNILIMAAAGLVSGVAYHLIVDPVDAFLFQPFWPRLIGGLLFSLITIISNCIIFPLFYPALVYLMKSERSAVI